MAARPLELGPICLTGPESCGKTWLADCLARRFHAPLVVEQARAWLAKRGGNYTESTLEPLAQQQREAEICSQVTQADVGPVVLDTDIQVLEVWWWRKYAPALWQRRFSHRAPARRLYPAWLQQELAKRTPRVYLLSSPDLPWVFDPLRESPGDRPQLFDHYRRLLVRDNLAYRVVSGRGGRRLHSALAGLYQLRCK